MLPEQTRVATLVDLVMIKQGLCFRVTQFLLFMLITVSELRITEVKYWNTNMLKLGQMSPPAS